MSSFDEIIRNIEKSLEKIEINSEVELAVLFIHSQFLINKFQLISTNENDSNIKKEDKYEVLEKLPLEWNTSTNNWTFIYKHETTSDKYYINIVKMMNMLTINAMIIEAEKVHSIQLPLSNLFQECTFPLTKIEKKYFNEEKFKSVINNINLEIIDKLLPTVKYHDLPVNQEPSRILPQDDNELEINNPLRIGRPNIRRNPINPMMPNPGNFDLDPFNSMGPSAGGGLIMGPNNPIFNNIGGDDDLESGGFYGGPTTLPFGAVPAGARFDPIGPFGNQSSRRNFNNRNSRNNRNNGFNSFEPDNDSFLPPGAGGGYDNMFL